MLFIILGMLHHTLNYVQTRIENEWRVYTTESYSTFIHLKKEISYRDLIIKKNEIKCLADNIYYEAATESYKGQLAVATVTLNRVKNKNFPKTFCEVVYQHYSGTCQFSWTCTSQKKPIPHLYKIAHDIAIKVIIDNFHLETLPANVLYYHSDYIQPNWKLQRVAQIGRHIFYKTEA